MLIDIKPRRQKPKWGSVELDFGHPLSFSLIGAWIFNTGGQRFIDLGPYRQPVSTMSGIPIINSVDGGSYLGDGSTTVVRITRKSGTGPANSGSIISVMASILPASVTGNQTLLNYGETTANDNTFAFGLAAASPGTGINGVGTASATATVAINTRSIIGVSQTGSVARRFYTNGIVEANTTSMSTLACTSGMAIGAGMFNQTPNTFWNGTASWIYSWSRALSDAEMAWVSAEPYAMLRPKLAVSYFGPQIAAASAVFEDDSAYIFHSQNNLIENNVSVW